jgi:hypothetical protein
MSSTKTNACAGSVSDTNRAWLDTMAGSVGFEPTTINSAG